MVPESSTVNVDNTGEPRRRLRQRHCRPSDETGVVDVPTHDHVYDLLAHSKPVAKGLLRFLTLTTCYKYPQLTFVTKPSRPEMLQEMSSQTPETVYVYLWPLDVLRPRDNVKVGDNGLGRKSQTTPRVGRDRPGPVEVRSTVHGRLGLQTHARRSGINMTALYREGQTSRDTSHLYPHRETSEHTSFDYLRR